MAQAAHCMARPSPLSHSNRDHYLSVPHAVVAVIGEVETEEREKDAYGNVYLTAAELQQQDAERRAARGMSQVRGRGSGCCGPPL